MTNLSTVSDIEKHSAAHVLAMAVARVFPHVKVGVGPVTKSGFYYDFDIPGEITKKKLKEIDDEVKSIIKEDLPFQQIIVRRAEAINMMLQRGQIYKSELINSIPDEEISFFKTGDEFIDLCRGPHVNSTNELGHIKISNVEKVHWNSDPLRPELTRISGMLFKNEEEVSKFETIENEKKSRDFFKFAAEKGYGFYDNGNLQASYKGYRFIENLYSTIEKNLESENIKRFSVNTNSGKFEDIVRIMDKAVFMKEPSFKSFPITLISRFISGSVPLKNNTVVSEVFFVKKYTRQNDVIFGINILEKFIKIFSDTNLEFYSDLKFHDLEDQMFKLVSNTLQRNLISHNKIQTNQKEIIEIELKLTDDLGRDWTFGKININYDNFDKTLVFNNKPTKISYLEFLIYPFNIFAYYLENHKENFPISLNPNQFVLIPVKKEYESYAEEIQRKLRKYNIFIEMAYGNTSFKSKIRKYEEKNIPIILIIGQKEVENESVSVRINNRDEGLITIENLYSYLEVNFFNK